MLRLPIALFVSVVALFTGARARAAIINSSMVIDASNSFPGETVHVVEASSFQLETTVTFHPWIAALLNFSPDHLDRHPDEAAYGRATARIFSNQGPEDWAVVNADSVTAMSLASSAPARAASSSSSRAAARLAGTVVAETIWMAAAFMGPTCLLL